MELLFLKKEDFQRWNTFLDSSPQATIYGKTWYLETLQCPFQVLVVEENSQIVGGIVLAKNPLGWYNNPLLCKYLGVYYGNFTGNEYNIETKQRKVAKILLPYLKKLQTFGYFFHPNFKNYLPFYLEQFSSKVFYSYWIDLKNQSFEQIKEKCYSKLKSEIKFAESSGYSIIEDIDFDTFYSVHEKTFLRQGGKSPIKKNFLLHYAKVLLERNAFKMFGVKDNQDNIMAVVGLIYDQNATSLVINGIDSERIKRGANEVLIMESIKFAKIQSNYFDFEGSMLENIDSFYRKFGGEHITYLKIYQNNILNFALEKGIFWYKKLKYGK